MLTALPVDFSVERRDHRLIVSRDSQPGYVSMECDRVDLVLRALVGVEPDDILDTIALYGTPLNGY